MARAEVHDTSVWIPILNSASPDAIRRLLSSPRVMMSSVVIAELMVGTRSPADRQMVDSIEATMRRHDRIITPTHDDWSTAAQLIRRRIRQIGPVAPRHHLADVLITVSVGRIEGGAVIVTQNVSHFEEWAHLARGSGLDVVIRAHQL